MKTIMSIMLGLSLLVGVATVSYAQDAPKKTKKGKKKGGSSTTTNRQVVVSR